MSFPKALESNKTFGVEWGGLGGTGWGGVGWDGVEYVCIAARAKLTELRRTANFVIDFFKDFAKPGKFCH